MYGRIRVRIRMQFSASLSGAKSGSGNDGWCLKMKSRLVMASIKVSRFSSAVSRVLRISMGEKRLKTSSADSGSSQNCEETISYDLHNGKVTYRCPVWIIRWDYLVLRKPENAFLEYKLRVGGPHGELLLLICGCCPEVVTLD
jgi:hypothetical protein